MWRAWNSQTITIETRVGAMGVKTIVAQILWGTCVKLCPKQHGLGWSGAQEVSSLLRRLILK
jgi:hypothetical protein